MKMTFLEQNGQLLSLANFKASPFLYPEFTQITESSAETPMASYELVMPGPEQFRHAYSH